MQYDLDNDGVLVMVEVEVVVVVVGVVGLEVQLVQLDQLGMVLPVCVMVEDDQ